MNINQRTELYGVIGDPVEHSLSPAMHNAAFSEGGVNAVYVAFKVNNLEACSKGIRELGIKGVSVTIPHKSAIIPFLDDVDPLAESIGAVNTVKNDQGRLKGYNTDAIGALRALEENTSLSGKSCILFGAGGAARAIGYILKDNDVRLTVVNRNRKRGEHLTKHLDCSFVPLNDHMDRGADIIIQTTSVGMFPDVEQCLIPEQMLKKGMVVMDIIYNPIETALLKMAKARGCITINGVHMFVHQGVEQFKLWTGIHPPIETMHRAVTKALGANIAGD